MVCVSHGTIPPPFSASSVVGSDFKVYETLEERVIFRD